MKYIPNGYDKLPVVELTRRNLTVLLAKLDDPASARTIIDGEGHVAVRAVEDAEHYKTRPAGVMYMPTANALL